MSSPHAKLRIAVVTWGRRMLGGAESYLAAMVPALSRAGYEVGLWCEMDQPEDREPIPLPAGTPVWCVAELGLDGAIEALRAWRPDVLFVHITTGPEVEAALLTVAPAVLFAHNYHGTCISGHKMHAAPVPVPCGRRLGPGCLLYYYPRRCGGLNPLTMGRDYVRNTRRRDLLPRYRAVLTNSSYMRDEYIRHGSDPAWTFALEMPVASGEDGPTGLDAPSGEAPWRLLFAGRMDRLKGGRTLLSALPRVAASLDSPIHLTLAGDGPDRAEWERRAARVTGHAGGRIAIEFVGWQDETCMTHLYRNSHLLIVPSTWPEPFGLVGPEAGRHGLPAAAFAVGGIPDWLRNGVNGRLAPADPPTARGLAGAVTRCLRDPVDYAALRAGAVRESSRFRMDAHLAALTRVFEDAVLQIRPER